MAYDGRGTWSVTNVILEFTILSSFAATLEINFHRTDVQAVHVAIRGVLLAMFHSLDRAQRLKRSARAI